MANIKIVTDSTAQLLPNELENPLLTVVPLNVSIDGTEYKDGETITRNQFVTKMQESVNLPTTSQPSIGTFVEKYDELGEDGSKIISIHMTEEISGTVNSARQAADLSKSDVTVVDSRSTDRGMTFQINKALEMIADGKDVPEILAAMEEIRNNTKLYVFVDNLDNLVKGGRISRVAGLMTKLTSIKLILEMVDGKLGIFSKGRGSKFINRKSEEIVEEILQTDNVIEVGMSYVDSRQNVDEIESELQKGNSKIKVVTGVTSPTIATHTGKGAFAVIYYNEPNGSK